MEGTADRTRDQVADEFADALQDAEDLLRQAADQTGDRAQRLRADAEAKLQAAKLRLQELEGRLVDNTRAAARRADEYVHERPWTSIGIAAAIGFVAGLLLNRR